LTWVPVSKDENQSQATHVKLGKRRPTPTWSIIHIQSRIICIAWNTFYHIPGQDGRGHIRDRYSEILDPCDALPWPLSRPSRQGRGEQRGWVWLERCIVGVRARGREVRKYYQIRHGRGHSLSGNITVIHLTVQDEEPGMPLHGDVRQRFNP
jgi:hypothetical protein